MTVRRNSPRAWFLAARPKTLPAALIPVVTATALAAAEGSFRLWAALLCVAFALMMQVAANFINDLYDYLKGTDREDRLGPERVCAQGWISPRAMRVGIVVTVVLACAVGLCLLAYGGWWLVWIGVACVVFAFLYTTLLSYCGLGDLLVWAFFGVVPVCGTYYVQAGHLTPAVGWVCAACALSVDTLLVVNNYRDRDTDRVAGKRTLIVVLGGRFGSLFYLLQGVAAYACCAALAVYGHRWAAVLPLLYLVAHVRAWREMVRIHQGRALNRLIGGTSRNMLLLAALLSVALLLP